MRIHSLKNWFWVALLGFFPLMLDAQHEDCRTAYIICSDSSFAFQPTGPGIDDFENPNNDQGCLFTRETKSVWFYFELREDMPIDSNLLGFVITDTVPDFVIDWDFSIYGANVDCDSLGSPYRCSFAKLSNFQAGSIIRTGFSENSIDTSESVQDPSADGFLKMMDVNPGDGFFLIVDLFVSAPDGGNLEDFDSTAFQTFNFDWFGTAAPWLNCIANPNCDQVVVDIGPDFQSCAGDSIQLNPIIQNTAGQESYTWTETSGRTDFLSDPTIPNPLLVIPPGFSGVLNFSLLVKEGACEHTDEIRIIIFDGGVPTITGDNIVCEGDLATLTAEDGFDSYLWSTGETTRTISVPGGATYRLTVTSGGACPGVNEFEVVEAVAPRPFIRGNNGICREGRGTVVLRAPDDYDSFLWSDGTNTATTSFFEVDTFQLVFLTVTDSLGCETTDSTLVDFNPVPIPEIMGDTILCEGDLDTLSVGVNFTSFNWTGDTTGILNLIQIVQPGTYNVEVEDTLGCIGRNSITVTERAKPLPFIDGALEFCVNEETTLTGPDNFEYLWSPNGETTQSITVDSSTLALALRVTDEFGCSNSTNIILNTLPLPDPNITGLDYICEGGATTLTADIFLDYIWSTGETTPSIVVDQAGTYSVTVTNGNNCRGPQTFDVTQRINPIPAINGDSILCPGEITTLSSTDNFVNYNWSTGDNTNSTTFDRAGTVTLSVIDSFGCPGNNTKAIDTLSAPIPQITGDTVFCEDESTLLTAEPGFVTYIWPDSSMNQEFSVDVADTITLIVEDNNGCFGTNDIIITERPIPVPTVTGDLNFCANETGLITAPVDFITYNWSTGETTRAIEVADPGNYEVTVVDDLGCEGTFNVDVDTIPIPQPFIAGGDFICENDTRLLFSNPFSAYEWSTGDTTGATLITTPGIYGLTVTDITGCQNSILKSIRNQPSPDVNIVGDDILCPGENTTLSTVDSFVTYEWSTGVFTSTLTTGFVPEVWVEVQDTFGCSARDTIALNSVPNPVVEIEGQLDICDGEGAILVATDGFETYAWSNGSDSVSTIARFDGVYTVTVTDINGCQNTDNQSLVVNANPKPEIQGNNTICRGEIATLSLRTNFLTYSWSTGETTEFIEVTESGDYIVTVTSPGDCINMDTFSIVVFEPEISPINNAVLDICDGDSLILNAGDGFVSYQWSTGQTDPIIQVRREDNYIVSVVDSNGCRTQANIRVNLQPLPIPNIIAPEVFCKGTPVSLLAGGEYRTYEWSNGEFGDIIEITEGGLYTLTVTDNNGCQGVLSVDLEEREAPEVEIDGDLLICRGDTTTLTVPDDFLYYIWTDDSNDTSVVVTEPGNYGVLVLSDNGCTGSDEVQVLFRPDPLPRIIGDLTKCSNQPGIIAVDSTYEAYEWLDGEEMVYDTSRQIEIDTPGVYLVRVTDDFGCENIARTIVQQVLAPTVNILGPPGICPGETLTLSVDSSFAMVNWSTGEVGDSITVDTPGVFIVQIEDTSQCAAIDTLELLGFTLPNFNLTGDTVFCEGDSVRIAIDRNFPLFEWSTGDTGTFVFADTTGTFSVRVENEDGCEATRSRTVFQNPAPDAFAGPDSTLNCFNDSIILGVERSFYASDVRINWTGPGIDNISQNFAQPLIQEEGTYIVQAVDTLTGCISVPDTALIDDVRYVPIVDIQTDEEVDCNTGSLDISGAGSQMGSEFDYQWTVGPQDSLIAEDVLDIVATQANIYKLRVFDRITGCENSDSLEVFFDPELPSAVIGPFGVLSCANPMEELNAAPAPPNSTWRFFWVFQENPQDTVETQDFIATMPGPYRLIVQNVGNGCTDIEDVTLLQNDIPPDISAGPDVELDCNLLEVQLGEPFTNPRWIIDWSREGDLDFVTAQQRPVVSEPGEYRLSVLDPVNGCISYDTVVVTLYDERPRSIDVNILDEECFGDNNGQIQVLQVIGGEGPYIFRVGEEGIFTPDLTQAGLAPGRYLYTVQDARGCEYDTTLLVNQGTDPMIELGDDRYISQGEYVRLAALTNIDDNAIQLLQWTQPDTLDCDTCKLQRLAPLKTLEFIATVVDTNGCNATDSVMVFVDRSKRVFIPNAFSPNGDGYNDRVTVFASANVKQVLQFKIFQRGGDQVFNRENFPPNDLSLGWDGFHRGRLLNSQVFAYFAEVEFDDGEIVFFEGGIALVR